MSAALVRSPGRPRDPGIDRAVVTAAIELLGEQGFDGMSIEAVAQRAGVGKPAIYRRWASKQDLVLFVLSQITDRPEMPAHGTARERLTAFMAAWIQAGQAAGAMRLSSSLLGAIHRNPDVAQAARTAFVDTRRQKVLAVMREGVRAGELRADTDVEVATDMLLAPLIVRRLITGDEITPATGRELVNVLFDGYGAHGALGDPAGTPRP